MKNLSLILILLSAFYSAGLAQTITATPGFNTSLPASSVSEAGSDYTTVATSAVNQTLINLRARAGIFTFTVSVHKIDTDWNNTLSVWVLRTGVGTSTGVTTTGGNTYQQVTNTTQYFFSGTTRTTRRRNGIPIQYQIRGASVLLPVKTYTTTVVYTISD